MYLSTLQKVNNLQSQIDGMKLVDTVTKRDLCSTLYRYARVDYKLYGLNPSDGTIVDEINAAQNYCSGVSTVVVDLKDSPYTFFVDGFGHSQSVYTDKMPGEDFWVHIINRFDQTAVADVDLTNVIKVGDIVSIFYSVDEPSYNVYWSDPEKHLWITIEPLTPYMGD